MPAQALSTQAGVFQKQARAFAICIQNELSVDSVQLTTICVKVGLQEEPVTGGFDGTLPEDTMCCLTWKRWGPCHLSPQAKAICWALTPCCL